jgi:hypothetical protein
MATRQATARTTVLALAVGILTAATSSADEGLWLFNEPPRKLLKEKYQFEPTAAWLEHMQKSSVRFNSGGSGSFVSADGLVMTNHHVGADCLQKLSTPEKNYLATGFHARTRAQEIKCLDLELNVLVSMEDVTRQIQAAVKPGLSAAEANKARRAVINTIENESLKKTGLRSDVVTLYQGGQFHLYRYKRYTDIRLVFAPEKDIAFYGGDPDNFEYPRYDLDICFFRVYENGKPAKTEHFLKWSKAGARDNELVFVSGHPGKTERLDTMVHLEFLRDVDFPQRLNVIRRREVILRTYCDRSPENNRRGEDELFSYQNSRKARIGMLQGLQDPATMARRQKQENDLKQAMSSPKGDASDLKAFDEIAESIKAWREIHLRHYLLERGVAFNSDLFQLARTLVRLVEEKTKPNAQRLREYAEAGLPSLQQQLFSEAPIYDDLERLKLGDSLGMLQELMGSDNDLVRKVLKGKSPEKRAAELVSGTKLRDVAVRKKIAEGDLDGVRWSADPMLQLASLVDEPARAVRKIYEERVEEPQRQACGKIARALFAVYGQEMYPDATFTLRLSFGPVKGYREAGKEIPWATDFAGLYRYAAEHKGREPYALPPRWNNKERLNSLDTKTPFNFVAAVDSIGGNSGSPVVNRKGELVGILFDGNIQSLVWDFVYTDEQARSVMVHSAGILEALRGIYLADELVAELIGKKQLESAPKLRLDQRAAPSVTFTVCRWPSRRITTAIWSPTLCLARAW